MTLADEPNAITTLYSGQFLEQKFIQPIPKPTNGFCVSYIQAQGFQNYRGNAITWSRYINSATPIVDAAVVLNESPLGHLALVVSVATSSFEISEQNFVGYGVVSTRSLSFDYKKIVGFIKK